jgi:hypothetical protein
MLASPAKASYFTLNPIKGELHKKASKDDVAEARWLWVDMDPREGKPLEEERAAMLALVITNLPAGIPKPNRVIDSGRGCWLFWTLETPQPTDGKNGQLTTTVESYGRGLEQAFSPFADNCHNIDRIGRLPGTRNSKTGNIARVLHEYSHDTPYAIENLPRVNDQKKKPDAARATDDAVLDKYEPVTRDAPELAKVDASWITRIFDGDTDGKYQGDRSRLAFAVACELVRLDFDDKFIARVLMTTVCGAHVQELPHYRLPRTIGRARDFAIDPDLEAMNNQHAVLPIGDKTRVVTWGDDPDFPGQKTIVRAQSFTDFKNLHSNRRKTVIAKDGNGKSTTTKKPMGTWWLGQPRRRQHDGGRRFMPQHEAEVVGDTLNMFEGFAVQPRKPDGRSGASGCQKFLDHGFKIICNCNEEHWDYLLKREAWIIQNRRRSEIAAAFRTEAEGSGKGFWCKHLGRLYGRHYMQINKPQHVIGKHNAHLETLLKLCADEALFVGDPRHCNALFGLITEPTITIEPKFVAAYPATNFLNIDMTTNSSHFVPASATARRFFIPTVCAERVGDLEYFNGIEAQLRDGGYEALLYLLKHEVDLRDFDVRKVPKTAALAEQAAYSRKGLDGLVEKVCSEGAVPCAYRYDWPDFSISADDNILREKGFDSFVKTHPDRELRNLGDLKVKNKLRSEWGCKTGNNGRRRHGSVLFHGIQWPPLQELRAKFEERHGPQDWLHPEVEEWNKPAEPVTLPPMQGERHTEEQISAILDEVFTRPG